MYNDNKTELQHWCTVPSISFELLKKITDGFSEKRKLGDGGYGVVYKGVYENGKEIAVKKLRSIPGLDDKQFRNEIQNLMRIQHKNIVQLVGYSKEERDRHVKYEGKLVVAQEIDRAICLEYLHNGSLNDYLTDESCGLDWPTRYEIIKGISEGLEYLHTGGEHPIYHLDLKPSNILLDENMVPKIVDFGLSRLFAGSRQSHTTKNLIGTFGYMPPEYVTDGRISKKYDVFSLGVIIIKIITGPDGYSNTVDMSPEKFIELVHENWKKKLQAKSMHASLLGVYSQQVKSCIRLALKCIEVKKDARPSITDITCMMNVTETSTCKLTGELLDVHPAELRFPFEENKSISCLLQLTNKTNDRVFFQLLPTIPRRYFARLLCGIVPPKSSYTLTVMMKEQKHQPPQMDEFLMLASSTAGEIDLQKDTSPGTVKLQYRKHFREAQEKGIKVQKLELMAVCDPQGETNSQSIHPRIKMISCEQHGTILGMDVHPMEPWILTGHNSGNVCIWNCQTQEIMNTFEVTQEIVWKAKFIAREQWFVAGDIDGFIHVYSYRTMGEVRRFRAHGSGITFLASHPTRPYLVSASFIGQVTLWDWKNDWRAAQTFEGHGEQIYSIAFDPNNGNSFASACWDKTVKIWSIGSRADISMLDGHSDKVNCVNYFTCGDRHYLITGSHDRTAKIWDLETEKCVKTLEGHAGHVNSVCSHPRLPILITGSWDRTLFIWNSNTFGLQRIFNFGLGIPRAIQCLENSTRVVLEHATGLAAVEIDNDLLVANVESCNGNTI